MYRKESKLPVEVLRRNVESLYCACLRTSRSTVRQIVVMQMNDTRRSKCHSVMERIGIYIPTRKSADVWLVSNREIV